MMSIRKNILPLQGTIRTLNTATFKKNLKTFLFRESYSSFWLNSCVTFALLHCQFLFLVYCIFLWSGWSACAVSPSRLSLSLSLSLMNNIKLPGEATLNTWNAWKPFGCRSSAWIRLGKITALLGPLTGGEGAGCPLSREPIPAVGPAGLRLQSFLQLGRKKKSWLQACSSVPITILGWHWFGISIRGHCPFRLDVIFE